MFKVLPVNGVSSIASSSVSSIVPNSVDGAYFGLCLQCLLLIYTMVT